MAEEKRKKKYLLSKVVLLFTPLCIANRTGVTGKVTERERERVSYRRRDAFIRCECVWVKISTTNTCETHGIENVLICVDNVQAK